MELFNGLPLYTAKVDADDTGMYAISLVDLPATECDFLTFDKEKELIKFKVENEEKRLVRGLVMGCNQPIYRRSGLMEYYIVYDAETLRKMAEKYLKMGLQNSVDTMHDEHYVDGVNMVQIFIKDAENGINPKGFEDYNDGSLFAEFHIENDEIWNQIKEGTFKGFSLAGIFDVEPVENEEDQEYNECLDLLDKLNKKLNRK